MSVFLSYRERFLIAMSVGIIIMYVFFRIGVHPFMVKLNDLNDRITAKKAFIHKNKKRWASLKEKDLKEQKFLESFKVEYPPDRAMAIFISYIEEISHKGSLKLIDIMPQPMGEEGPFKKASIKLSLHGSFLEIIEFIYTLQEGPHQFMVEEFLLENNKSLNREGLRARLVLGKRMVF